jgi:hypothetical protein
MSDKRDISPYRSGNTNPTKLFIFINNNNFTHQKCGKIVTDDLKRITKHKLVNQKQSRNKYFWYYIDKFDITLTVQCDILYNKTNEKHIHEFYSDNILTCRGRYQNNIHETVSRWFYYTIYNVTNTLKRLLQISVSEVFNCYGRV